LFQLIINEPHFHHEEKEKETDFFADCENDDFTGEPVEKSLANTVGFVDL
jgi:hypothetical protein